MRFVYILELEFWTSRGNFIKGITISQNDHNIKKKTLKNDAVLVSFSIFGVTAVSEAYTMPPEPWKTHLKFQSLWRYKVYSWRPLGIFGSQFPDLKFMSRKIYPRCFVKWKQNTLQTVCWAQPIFPLTIMYVSQSSSHEESEMEG